MKLVALNHAPKYSAAATIRRNATQRRMITSPTRKQLASVPLRIPRATSPGDKEKEPVEDDKDVRYCRRAKTGEIFFRSPCSRYIPLNILSFPHACSSSG